MPHDELGLKPPQFRLRTLMVAISAVAVLCATFVAVGPLATFVLVLALLALFAHVAGAAIGTQLRENSDRHLAAQLRSHGPRPQLPSGNAIAQAVAPPTRLSERYRLGWPNVLAVVAGFLLGAGLGGSLLVAVNWEKITLASASLGATAFGCLGGMAGFAVGGFAQVGWKAWREAISKPRRRPW